MHVYAFGQFKNYIVSNAAHAVKEWRFHGRAVTHPSFVFTL